jgi:hypothetical protein
LSILQGDSRHARKIFTGPYNGKSKYECDIYFTGYPIVVVVVKNFVDGKKRRHSGIRALPICRKSGFRFFVTFFTIFFANKLNSNQQSPKTLTEKMSKEIEYVRIISKEKHEFFIGYAVARKCEGIWDVVKDITEVNDGIVKIELKEYTKETLEIIIEYLYYKHQNYNENYAKLEEFHIPPHKALGVFKAAMN